MSFPLQSILPCSRKLTNHKINVIIYNLYVFLSMSLSFLRFTVIFCMLLFLIVNKAAMWLQASVTNEYSDVALISNFFTQLKTQLTVCYYHVTYAFQGESTLYSCLNVKELLASLAKWLSVRLRTKWLWVRVSLQSLENTTFVQRAVF